jgi:pyruvate/2-oxoglutarate/acetoin dehydrogenase E1 component/TPP-dependent pyruvate/acetoin dehydrogenase alpha subunit
MVRWLLNHRPFSFLGTLMQKVAAKSEGLSLAKGKLTLSREDILSDYRVGYRSRMASLTGRKEVLTGKAKFGIFGDGKEVPQLAMARSFREGDIRSGYYRDQTVMMAAGLLSLREFFAQLYADTHLDNEPASAGRQMNCHFATRMLTPEGKWLPLVEKKQSSSDISPTAGQMSRLLGLAYASKLYRQEAALAEAGGTFSRNGNEVAFGTIGDASTSEGIFWETLNAAGVLQVPLVMSVWDDGYGISVPREFQTTKGSISEALAGFQSRGGAKGFDIQVVAGWDYPALVESYFCGVEKTRREHTPSLFHIVELTQPQGHSTSGSHERYKSKERLAWEDEHDCLRRMRRWIIEQRFATEAEIDDMEKEDRALVETARKEAWEAYQAPIRAERERALQILDAAAQQQHPEATKVARCAEELRSGVTINRRLILSTLRKAVVALTNNTESESIALRTLCDELMLASKKRYASHLYSESQENPTHLVGVPARYSDTSETVDGRVVLLRLFDHFFQTNPLFFALGEDVGKLGDVNLVFDGLNAKYGDLRVTDTGIREATILGQGIGCAMRGLRPLVDIQYLDYLLYALQVMSDDLATLHFRTAGGQKAPVIIRTKGHRLEGIWHTGSPIGMILNAVRGLYVCVPRNMTQAAGLYNTLFAGDNPALVIEVLNGYRLKEKVPDNLTEFRVALGTPEVIQQGTDVTVVTYGACVRVAQEAAAELADLGVSLEIIDVQTLIPFDTQKTIVKSLEKTNMVIFMDEDVPGGASAYMMQQVLEVQRGYDWLDAPPRTLTALESRSPFASDGDYICKPSSEDLVELTLSLMRERFSKSLR